VPLAAFGAAACPAAGLNRDLPGRVL